MPDNYSFSLQSSTSTTSALLNSTFCVNATQSQQSLAPADKGQDARKERVEHAGKRKRGRPAAKKLDSIDPRSSEEFERPAPQEEDKTKKKSRMRPVLQEVDSNNSGTSGGSDLEMVTPKNEGEELLEGGIRRKRKLINPNQSFFSPLT